MISGEIIRFERMCPGMDSEGYLTFVTASIWLKLTPNRITH